MKRPGTQEKWRSRDRKVLWHPFAQHNLWETEDFPVIASGDGIYLFDVEGNKYIDGVSSIWLNVHGHRKPEIDREIEEQLHRMGHSTFLGLSHPPGIMLAEKLVEIAPAGISRVFYSDNGSTAMEIALKMSYQYWCQQETPEPDRNLFVRLTNAYHGDTLGAVSVGGIEAFHAAYYPLIFPTLAAPAPYCRRCPLPDAQADCRAGSGCLAELEKIIDENRERVAGVVIEPRVQGATGIVVQPEGFIRGVREICDKYGVLMVADEVAVGLGRTGHMFACLSEDVTPDLMSIGKGLSGGYLPMAATMTTEKVFDAFRGPDHHTNTFFHGHSFTGNPLGCAASLASLDLFEKEGTIDKVRKRSEQAAEWLRKIAALDHVGEARQAGLMMGIELEEDPATKTPYGPSMMMGRRAIMAARQKGLIIRPLSDVVIVMPPLCVTEAELDTILETAMESIREVTE